MALDGNALGQAIASAIKVEARKENISAESIWKAIANEIVKHFKTNAEVTVNAGIPVTTSGICTIPATGSSNGTGQTTEQVTVTRTGQTTEIGTGIIS